MLLAHYLDGRDREETRRQFGYSYTGFTTRLHRARGRLRERLRGILGVAVTAGASVFRRAEAAASAPVATGGGGAIVAHVALAGVVWLMVTRGTPDGRPGDGVPTPQAAAVSLVGSASGERVGLRPLAQADGSDRHNAGDSGYARLGDGQYLGANSPLFDYVGEDGLTIEAWFYFDEAPQADERWVLLRKEGSYLAEYWGPDTPAVGAVAGELGAWSAPSFVYGTIRQAENGNRHLLQGDRAPRRSWVHIGLQYSHSRSIDFAPTGELAYAHAWHDAFVRDGSWAGGGSSWSMRSFTPPYYGRPRGSEGHVQVPRADTPLVVGAALATGLLGSPAAELLHQYRRVTPTHGRVGEVRVSSIARYPVSEQGERKAVPGRFETDEHTVALWHLDEGPGATEYADASGNGHTLYVRSSGD